MKRSLSTIFTALLLTVTLVPHAMAQTQQSGFSASPSTGAGTIAEPPASDAANQANKTEGSPEISKDLTTTAKAVSSESRPSVNSAYPGYCPSLPPGTQPGDWAYREALEHCLYGS